ncbi:MAG TPA: phosphoesterase [Blastocatellia bacterium]|nr:phosphoesterase [Blastocatellia bacterium]
MRITVLHHDHCFDGFASAAVFSRLLIEKIRPDADVSYTGLSHKPNQKFIEEELFTGDENAIVDFKYSPSERLTWWFDHHQSAFLSPEDEKHYYQGQCATKFYDPAYKSCTKFIADIAAQKYGFDPAGLAELIHWADIIDGAQYENAKAAVDLEAPALQLMLVIEASRNPALMEKIIRQMQTRKLAGIVADPDVSAEFRPLFEHHNETLKIIQQVAEAERGVVYFDLSGYDAVGYSKFIPYYLFPDIAYSVGVSLSPNRSKISVGFNPWSPVPRRHNLASICERYDGGGHAVVGAISLRSDQIETARKIAAEIVSELRS